MGICRGYTFEKSDGWQWQDKRAYDQLSAYTISFSVTIKIQWPHARNKQNVLGFAAKYNGVCYRSADTPL